MISFTVHERPDPPADRIDRAAGVIFVRDGFSWSAALFTPLWMLAHRLWWPLLAYVVAAGVLELLRQVVTIDTGWLTLATLALGLLIGFEAATLRRWSLARRGWTTLGSVSGRNAQDCERRFFDLWLPTQPVLAQPAASADSSTSRGQRSLIGALSGAK
jgi:hypothetical protein